MLCDIALKCRGCCMRERKLGKISVEMDIPVEDIIDMDALMEATDKYIEEFIVDRLEKAKDKCKIKETLNFNLEIEHVGTFSDTLPVLCKPIPKNKPKDYISVDLGNTITKEQKQQIAEIFNSDKIGKPIVKINLNALIEKHIQAEFDEINNEFFDDEEKEEEKQFANTDEIERFLNNKFPKDAQLGWLESKDYDLAVKLVGKCLEKNVKIDVNNELISHYVRSIHNKHLLGFDYGESPKKSTIQKSIKVLEFIRQNYPDVLVTTLDALEKFYELSGRYEDALSCFAPYITQTKIIGAHTKDSVLRIKYKGNMPVTVNELLSVTKPATKFITDKQNEFVSEANSIYSGFNIAGYTDFLQYIGNKYNKTLKKNFYTFRAIEEFSEYCSYLSRTAENKLREKYGQRLLKLDPEYAKYKWYK